MDIRNFFRSRVRDNGRSFTLTPDGKFAPILDDDQPAPPYATLAIQDLLSIGLAAATYHGLQREDANFDLIIGEALAQRYIEEPRSRLQFGATASALKNHCSDIATNAFLQTTAQAGFDHDFSIDTNGRLQNRANRYFMNAIMDMYDVGEFCAEQPNFEMEWAPFSGASRRLYDAGYIGLPKDHPDVVEAQVEFAQKVFAG